MKKLYSILRRVVCVMLALAIMTPLVAYADSPCKHKYKNDVCTKCGALRVHEFNSSITFYTAKDDVPIWSKPTKYSARVETISDQDTSIQIDGILRNEYGNVWFRISDEETYVYIENLYLDFGTLVLQNYQLVTYSDDPAVVLGEFYNLVKPGGRADYKVWLDPGGKSIPYTVRLGTFDYYNMTAEELGNIHYGYLARALGVNTDIILYAGGAVNQLGNLNWNSLRPSLLSGTVKCLLQEPTVLYPVCVIQKTTKSVLEDIYFECAFSYCDDPKDAKDVRRGIDYFETGALNN